MLIGEVVPLPWAPGLEQMLMEKQRVLAKEAPLVPGIIRAESSFNCFSVHLPTKLASKMLAWLPEMH